MKELYILPISEAELIDEEYCQKHFPKRLERAKRFKFREDKLRCIGAGVLLCCVAGIREEELTFNQYGKPMSEGKNFSISHSGDYVILAVSDGPVGADIERLGRKYADIVKRVCTEEETRWLDESETINPPTDSNEIAERDKKFFTIWTLKESIIKSEGKGLSMDMRSFSVLPMIEGEAISIEGREYYGESFNLGGHMISVCGSNEPTKQIHITKEML